MRIRVNNWKSGELILQDEADSLAECLEARAREKANLSEADLSEANLSGAYLSGANLVIAGGWPDGWQAYAWPKNGVLMVQVGCRSKSITEARSYWANKEDRREVVAFLDYAETVARIRGWEIK